MSSILKHLIILFVLVISTVSVRAEDDPSIKVLETLFTSEKIETSLFEDPNFKTAVDQVLQSLKPYGKFDRIEKGQVPGAFTIFLEKAKVKTTLQLNAQNQITGIQFLSVDPIEVNLKTIYSDFDALEGQKSFVIIEGNKTIAQFNEKLPLAVGSAFKMVVLRALMDKVEDGTLKWSDSYSLREEWKHLPSDVGIRFSQPGSLLWGFPVGSSVTIQTMASLMIALSDNTATDALIYIVGRENIEKYAQNSIPLITTKELYAFRHPQNADLLHRFRESNLEEKRNILFDINQRPFPLIDLGSDPKDLDVEWYFSTSQLCSLISEIKHLPLMQINPGIVERSEWKAVAFKGGSEPGVLNLTTWLETKDGKSYCVSSTWNDSQALDSEKLYQLYNNLISYVKKASTKPAS